MGYPTIPGVSELCTVKRAYLTQLNHHKFQTLYLKRKHYQTKKNLHERCQC